MAKSHKASNLTFKDAMADFPPDQIMDKLSIAYRLYRLVYADVPYDKLVHLDVFSRIRDFLRKFDIHYLDYVRWVFQLSPVIPERTLINSNLLKQAEELCDKKMRPIEIERRMNQWQLQKMKAYLESGQDPEAVLSAPFEDFNPPFRLAHALRFNKELDPKVKQRAGILLYMDRRRCEVYACGDEVIGMKLFNSRVDPRNIGRGERFL